MDDLQAVADYLAAVHPTPGPDPQPPPDPASGHTTRSLTTRVSWEVLLAALFVLAFGFVILRYDKRGLQGRIELPAKFFAQFTEKKGQSARSRASESLQGGINPIRTALAAGNASAPVPVAAASSGDFYVRIQAREDASLSIIADGKRVMYDTLVANTEKTVRGHNQIVVRAGNVGALDFSFNGQELPIQGHKEEARTLMFDAKGLQPAAPQISLPVTSASVEQSR